LTESLVQSGVKDANDLNTFRRLKTVFSKMGMELYDLSIFTTLSLHFAYREFKSKLGDRKQKSKFYGKDCILPIISSECPGWVCYAEKRCGELALPHMSTVKSSQQLFGSFMRMRSLNTKVVTIMPCYDKKLEAVRPDFKFAPDESQIKEVDTVLATHEL
jgi:iron only hydrogenase large subunit-like protein